MDVYIKIIFFSDFRRRYKKIYKCKTIFNDSTQDNKTKFRN